MPVLGISKQKFQNVLGPCRRTLCTSRGQEYPSSIPPRDQCNARKILSSKCKASSFFSYGFALTRTYFGTIEPAAIGEPQRKRRLKIRSALVTSNSICSFAAHDFPYLPSFLFDFSVLILSCMSSMSHEPFSGTPWWNLRKQARGTRSHGWRGLPPWCSRLLSRGVASCAPPSRQASQVWRVICLFGKHQSPTSTTTKVQKSESSTNKKSRSHELRKSRNGKVLEIEKSKSFKFEKLKISKFRKSRGAEFEKSKNENDRIREVRNRESSEMEKSKS